MVRLLPKRMAIVYSPTPGFNPTMVRLLRVVRIFMCGNHEYVSIPQWCDCCVRAAIYDNKLHERFNPTMVRLLQARRQLSRFGQQCFNPTMVRLLRFQQGHFQQGDNCFNPTMVRLLRYWDYLFKVLYVGFNPTMVRLLPSRLIRVMLFRACFNPTMVRLLLGGLSGKNSLTMFQSHNGAIAALGHFAHRKPKTFVSIPQWCDCCASKTGGVEAVVASFNPTMVRLLPELVAQPAVEPAAFQSHNGAIAAFASLASADSLPLVSIPQWCDCCLQAYFAHEEGTLVSIPQWCDCCA